MTATASLKAEREGYERERLNQLMRAEKGRQLVKEGEKAEEVSVSPANYPALLRKVYKRADMPKPRNLVGLIKDQARARA